MSRGAGAKRRSQKERRRATQAAILQASMELLLKEGYAGFSASRCAARAGISRGAQEHYYPKKVDLIGAVTQHAMDEAVAHARLLAERARYSVDPVAQFLLDSEHFFFHPLYRAFFESRIAARSDKALARVCDPIVRKARATLNQIWTDTLRDAGYSHESAQKFVELTHYFLRGLFVVKTWLPYRIDRADAVETWHRLAPAALLSRAAPPMRAVGNLSRKPRKVPDPRPRSTGRNGSVSRKNQERSL